MHNLMTIDDALTLLEPIKRHCKNQVLRQLLSFIGFLCVFLGGAALHVHFYIGLEGVTMKFLYFGAVTFLLGSNLLVVWFFGVFFFAKPASIDEFHEHIKVYTSVMRKNIYYNGRIVDVISGWTDRELVAMSLMKKRAIPPTRTLVYRDIYDTIKSLKTEKTLLSIK